MKYKRFIFAICVATVLTLSACGTVNTVPSAEVPLLPVSSALAPEIPDASAQQNGDSNTGETDTERESQDMEQENISLPLQVPEAPAQPEENAPLPTEPENPPESAAEERTKILIAYFTWAENTVVHILTSKMLDIAGLWTVASVNVLPVYYF